MGITMESVEPRGFRRTGYPVGFRPSHKTTTDGDDMTEAERVFQLIDDIYGAALDPAQWPQVMAKTSLFCNGDSGDQELVDDLDTMLDEGVASVVRRRADVLASHFRRARAIGKMLDLHKVEAATFADTLDGFAAGMFLVDAEAYIVHANASGQAMLDGGAVVRERSGRLIAADRKADHALREALTAAAAGRNENLVVSLRPREGECWNAHVLPLASGLRRQTGASYAAVAAVFIRKAALNPCPLEAIASLYGLTPAELRVLTAIVEIGGVPEVAPALGVSETTVKSHLKSLFEKTGTKRQADLVKLVASHMSPIA
jgi:DNA-binding CsgD family transcriptional regulator/PAS domain-containing protein